MEAFCYSISDHATGRIYVGYHRGTLNDGYLCSSEEVLNEYKNRSGDFTRQIIATGTKEDMFALETKILVSTNAMRDSSFYNKSNNFGRNCSNPTKDTQWWNDGANHKRGFESPSPNWKPGRLNVKIGGATRFGPHSEDTRKLMSDHAKTRLGTKSATFGMICINDGVRNVKIKKSETIPIGWKRGMLINKSKTTE